GGGVDLDADVDRDGVEDVGELVLVVNALARGDEHDPDILQVSLPSPVVRGEVHDLLGSAGALHFPAGAGEHDGTGPDPADDRPRLLREVEGVVARYPFGSQRLGHAGDGIPVQFDPGGQDEGFV